MYCPKCRTEYREGFNTCADCEITLVEELPPTSENELLDNRLHPIRNQIGKTIDLIRKNQKASWIFSVLVGVIYYFIFGIGKNIWALITWRLTGDIASLIDSGTNLNSIKVIFITVIVNIFIDLPAAIIASLLCAGLMIYVLRKQQILFSMGAAASFFLIIVRRWHFWKAPNIGVMISSFIGPFLVAFVFIASVWLLVKFRMQNRQRN